MDVKARLANERTFLHYVSRAVVLVAGGATFFERRAHHYRTEVAESGRREGRAELLAKRSCYLKEGVHLGESSVRRNWYRSLSTSLVPPEGFGKLLHFRKIPKKIGQNLAKINSAKFWQNL